MAFLSLARGDSPARALLQRAIAARYGLRPLRIESARMEMVGKSRGPLGLPLKATAKLTFVVGSHWRWDQQDTLLGIPVRNFTISFDSGARYERHGRKISQDNQAPVIAGSRCRLWAESAALLTPLTAEGVMLRSLDARTFQATSDPRSRDIAIIRLNDDDTVSAVEVNSYHVDKQCEEVFIIRPEGGLQTLDGFTVPRQITYQWGTEAPQRFTVTRAEANPKIPLTEFTIT